MANVGVTVARAVVSLAAMPLTPMQNLPSATCTAYPTPLLRESVQNATGFAQSVPRTIAEAHAPSSSAALLPFTEPASDANGTAPSVDSAILAPPSELLATSVPVTEPAMMFGCLPVGGLWPEIVPWATWLLGGVQVRRRVHSGWSAARRSADVARPSH